MLKATAALVLTLLAATPACADDWDFVLINHTGKPIHRVELAPAGTTDWQANRVDPDLRQEGDVNAGGRMIVHFDKANVCKYDVKGSFSDGTAAVWPGVNICDNSYVTIKFNAAGAPIYAAN